MEYSQYFNSTSSVEWMNMEIDGLTAAGSEHTRGTIKLTSTRRRVRIARLFKGGIEWQNVRPA